MKLPIFPESSSIDDLDADLAVGRDHERADVFRQVEAVRRLLEVIVGRLEGLHQSAVPWINWTG